MTFWGWKREENQHKIWENTGDWGLSFVADTKIREKIQGGFVYISEIK